MSRIKIELPAHFHFKTEIPIRVTEINYGGHLGNDSLLSIIQEARVQFLNSIGSTEINFFGVAMIMSDVAVVYKSEGFYGEVLTIEIAVAEISRVGFELLYKVSESKTNREVAFAKTGMISFDYKIRKVVALPIEFKKIFL
ncbi:thioesterase [Bacteroidota bacterium]|nr:thioesterase [Bacteroidota bacterium]